MAGTGANSKPITAAIIVAAGRGLRAGGGVPKQWRPLDGRLLAAHALDRFACHPGIDRLVLVVHPDDIAIRPWEALPEAASGPARHPAPKVATFFADAPDPGPDGAASPEADGRRRPFSNPAGAAEPGPAARLLTEVVAGGSSRSASVLAGLEALAGQVDVVLIHDAARPLVSAALIDRVLAALAGHDGAAPALAVTDALWRGQDGVVAATQTRDGLFRAQTPQGFHLSAILAAHRAHGTPAADDVETALAAGMTVAIVAGDEDNIKVTRAGDFRRAERLLLAGWMTETPTAGMSARISEGKTADMSETLIGAGRDLAVGEMAVGELAVGPLDVRCGNGFDVHAFCPGDHVMLCGVAVPHDSGLLGHSDADVGMHALTDAIYGALARGDIGRHFPPDDPQWKGAASSIFLTHACDLARQMGLRLSNADVTLICEHPKIGPHAAEMAAVLARICGIDAARVSVKATTSERLGFTGRGEGIAALATVTLMSGGSGATASGGSARPGSVTAGGAAPDGVQAAPAPPATDARDVAARAAAPPVSIAPDAAAPGLRTSAAAAPGSGPFPAPQVTPPPGPDIPSAAPAVRR